MSQPEAAAPSSNVVNSNTSAQTSTGNANMTTPTATTATTSTTEEILYSAFRQKTIDMKHWVPLPDSMPSVRFSLIVVHIVNNRFTIHVRYSYPTRSHTRFFSYELFYSFFQRTH
jgi:hypothetical protein